MAGHEHGRTGPVFRMDEVPMIGSRPMFYRLDAEHNVVPATRGDFVAIWEGEDPAAHIRVRREQVGDADVSTVFLPLGSALNFLLYDEPRFFETVIFRNEEGGRRWQYATWDDAVAGHERVVAALQEGREP